MILAGIWETTIADETVDVLVTERDGEVVGWANASCARDGRAPTDRELRGIYVVRAVYGSGTGQRLLDAIIGDAPAHLRLLEGNARAEAFYTKNGFRRDGSERRVEFEPLGWAAGIAGLIAAAGAAGLIGACRRRGNGG